MQRKDAPPQVNASHNCADGYAGSGASKRPALPRNQFANMAEARAKFLERFEREVDPDGMLAPGERARRAHHGKPTSRALALASAKERAKAMSDS